MRKTLAFRPAAQFEATLGSASEAFRLRCQAQNLSTGTLGWYVLPQLKLDTLPLKLTDT